MQAGTTSEKNVADYFGANAMKYKAVVFDTAEAITSAFFAGRCQVYTTDMSDLAGARSKAPKPDDYVILPQVISKEPLGPSVRRGDDEWFQIVRWTGFAMLEAEENGLTQANVDTQKKDNKDLRRPAFSRRLEDTGKLLGLDGEWAYRIVSRSATTARVSSATSGRSRRANSRAVLNSLWTKGGLMYAHPAALRRTEWRTEGRSTPRSSRRSTSCRRNCRWPRATCSTGPTTWRSCRCASRRGAPACRPPP